MSRPPVGGGVVADGLGRRVRLIPGLVLARTADFKLIGCPRHKVFAGSGSGVSPPELASSGAARAGAPFSQMTWLPTRPAQRTCQVSFVVNSGAFRPRQNDPQLTTSLAAATN